MYEERFSSFLIRSGIASKAEADRIVDRTKRFLSAPALLEPPYGPFDKEDTASLRAIAEKTGKPDFFLAFMRARFEEPILYNVLFGEPSRKAVFLRTLDLSMSRYRDRRSEGENHELSEPTIVTQVHFAIVNALDSFGLFDVR